MRAPLLSVAMAVLAAQVASAQLIQVDRGVRAAGLWCFPMLDNPRDYVYIPASARLAQDEQGQPQFSFVRYVATRPAAADTSATITEAGGGGILTFLVLYETPPEAVSRAQTALRDVTNDDEVTLRGPIVFDAGKYALVSSIINPDSGAAERRLLATGNAPVLEGNRLALSFDLTPQQATLLLKSFEMATPDVSLVFDMAFSGLTDAYEAELTIDWSEVRKSQAFRAGGTVYFVSADVELAFDELRRNNAIRLKSAGADSTTEGLLNTVYAKLLDLLFRPVEAEQLPPAQHGGLLDAIGALFDPRSGPLSSRKTTGFGLYAGYKLKELRTEGMTVLNFNHRSKVERHATIVFNIGDFYARYGKDQRYFRTVNVVDPVFTQRQVHVIVDGALLPDFEGYINSVTVTLRKQHQNGKETLQEVVIDRSSFSQTPSKLGMTYGWDEDNDRMAWLGYDYRTHWSFKGGGEYQSDWKHTEAPMIDVFAPYERRSVQLVGDAEKLKERGVRAAIVQIEYPFFGQRRKHQLVARPDQPIEEQKVEIVLPQGQYDYDYAITWHTDQGTDLTAKGRDNSGLVFVDEIPAG